MGVQFSITGLATFAVKVYNELLFIIIIIIYYKLSVKAYSLRTDWPQPMIEVYVNLAFNALGEKRPPCHYIVRLSSMLFV